ncbi:unknown [Prevotella sp. CAG:873]|nr:unknown [Prevotella sp. CAG:873]
MNAASPGRRIALYKLGDFGRRCSGICIAPRKPGMYGAQGYGLVAQQQSSFSHKVNRVFMFFVFLRSVVSTAASASDALHFCFYALHFCI